MIATALDFYENFDVERRIKELREQRRDLGEEIDKLKIRYPRCPHCEKRYYIGKYRYYVPFLIPSLDKSNCYISVKCPLGHVSRILLSLEEEEAAAQMSDEEFAELIGGKIEEIDYGYME